MVQEIKFNHVHCCIALYRNGLLLMSERGNNMAKFEIQYMLKTKQGILLKEIVEAPTQGMAQEMFDAKWNGAAKRITTLKR